jgi:hypothetical protein
MDLYSEIIKIENIRDAYLNLTRNFDEKLKTRRYSGLDSVKLFDLDFVS